MKNLKHTLAIIISVVMILSLMAACGGDSGDAGPSSAAGTEAPSQNGAAETEAPAKPDDGKVYELSLSTHDPATSNKTIYLQSWADEINEASGGRINITVYAGGSLAIGTAALDALRSGVCDIAWLYTSYFSGQFPLSEVICNPIGISSVPQAVDVLDSLYAESDDLQNELSEFQVLMMHSNPTNKITTTEDHPISSLSDLKGLTFRASAGTASDLLMAWGATPIQMAPGDIYQAVQKGTVDGYVFDWSGIISFGLQEIPANYVTMPVYLGPYYLMMNADSFNGLPEDLQQLVKEHSGYDASVGMSWVYEADERKGRVTIEEAGGNFIDLSDADVESFKEASQTVLNAWIEKNTSGDFDAAGYLDKASALAEQYYISTDDINSTLDEMGW